MGAASKSELGPTITLVSFTGSIPPRRVPTYTTLLVVGSGNDLTRIVSWGSELPPSLALVPVASLLDRDRIGSSSSSPMTTRI